MSTTNSPKSSEKNMYIYGERKNKCGKMLICDCDSMGQGNEYSLCYFCNFSVVLNILEIKVGGKNMVRTKIRYKA